MLISGGEGCNVRDKVLRAMISVEDSGVGVGLAVMGRWIGG